MSTKNKEPETEISVVEENPPSPVGTLKAMENADHMSLKVATNELIANSIEQGAKEISLWLNNEEFGISDNGNGCDDMRALSKLGKHYHTSDLQKIGRYGIGLKDAAVWMGWLLIADSLHGETGQKLSMTADWDEMIQYDKWLYTYRKGSKRITSGMTLRVYGLRNRRFHAWYKMAGWIAENFSAAIQDGITIRVDGVAVVAKPDPALDEKIEFSGSWKVDGVTLTVKGFCGILKNRKEYESGWEVQFGPMVITKGYQKEGFGKYSPQGFYGRINLIDTEGGKWTLTRNKTVAQELGGILNCDEMQQIVRPILEKLKQQHRTLALRLTQAAVEVALNNMLQNVKATLVELEEEGHKTGKTRRIKPAPGPLPEGPGGRKTERTERKNAKQDPQSKIKKRMNKAMVLEVRPHETPAEYGLGYVSVTEEGTRITVFFDNSTPVAEAIWKDEPLLLYHAIALLAHYFTFGDDNPSWVGRQMKLWEDEQDDCRKAAKVWLFLLKNAVGLKPVN